MMSLSRDRKIWRIISVGEVYGENEKKLKIALMADLMVLFTCGKSEINTVRELLSN
jgi:hypothetical protein